MKTWYTITAKGEAAEIAIYDEIGAFGITAKTFMDDLKGLGEVKAITLRLNSPGGAVFDGVAIHNALQRHPATVTAHVDGIAASIASVIAMGADRVVMAENAMMMIHDPAGLVWGTAADMRQMADALDKVKASIITAYAAKTKLPDDELDAIMSAESWFTAAEAVAKGFADEVAQPVKMAASFDLTRYRNAPTALKNSAEIEARTRAEIAAYAAEVTSICAAAGAADKAAAFIAKNTPLDDVRAALLRERADADQTEIGNHHSAPIEPSAGWERVYARVGK